MHLIMAILNLGQDVANKREKKTGIMWPYSKLQECVVAVLLLKSSPLFCWCVRVSPQQMGPFVAL